MVRLQAQSPRIRSVWGYKSIEAAVKLVNGEEVESFIDTGCYWYDADNMDDPQIAPLLYD